MRVIVCGGRKYNSKDRVFSVLDSMHAGTPITYLICGAADGADMLAAHWAATRGVPYQLMPADWKSHGIQAGPIRNAAMLQLGLRMGLKWVIAFPGGRGTANMVQIAKRARVSTMEIMG